LERIDNGDFNWIIPGKLGAFSCPVEEKREINGFHPMTPEEYATLFHQLGIGTVIRLTKPTYDASRFTSNGIDHHEAYFPDGSSPP
jgi:cell division cycle 14